MNCTVCSRLTSLDGACRVCTAKLTAMISELPDLQWQAGFFIEPSRTGSGTVSAERSLGVNVNALDFAIASDLLPILHGWEIVIRRGRSLTPPALVPVAASLSAAVADTCAFHLAHLNWSLCQPWAVEFAGDVYGLHAKGRSAAKKFREQARRIPCPTDDCKRFVVIDVEAIASEVSCFGCKQKWTVTRLIALAMSNPNRQFFLDVEAISAWLGIAQREIYRLIRKHKIEKRGQMYDLAAIVQAKNLQKNA